MKSDNCWSVHGCLINMCIRSGKTKLVNAILRHEFNNDPDKITICAKCMKEDIGKMLSEDNTKPLKKYFENRKGNDNAEN